MRRRREYRRTAPALAALMLLASAAGAQSPATPAQPTFRAGVQVIEVDVRVFDGEGRFVEGLTAGDFELLENGQPQSIDAVHELSASRPAAAVTGATPVPTGATAAPHTWVFHFDLNHLSPGGGFERARAAVESFIADRFRDGDLAGVVAGEKMINNRLTSVRTELRSAVRDVKPRPGNRARLLELNREWPRLLDFEEAIRIARNDEAVVVRAVGRACNDDPDACERGTDLAEVQVRAKGRRLQQEVHRAATETLAALNGLATGLTRIPGPKSIVFLSDGFVSLDLEASVQSVIGNLARAGARVYAIDVRGLNRVGNPGIIDQELVGDVFDSGLTSDAFGDGANSLAVDTGGVMIRNENNIGRALDGIAADAGRYYVLAYRPAISSLDGKYRPITVRVKREGVRVRARKGYVALETSLLMKPAPIPPAATTTTTTVARPDPVAAVAAESAGASVPPAAAPPETTTGRTMRGATEDRATDIRLRPDSEARVNALAAREPAVAATLAATGWDAYQRGDLETAHDVLSKAAVDPGARPWVLYALGMSQAALGRAAGAIASWERVRRAAPDFQPVYMDLADAYAAQSDLTSALATVRSAEARWPDSADVHSAIGVILVRRGALDDGIAALSRATALTPDDPLGYLNLGRAYALRYQRNRRYVTSQRRWVAPEGDREKAIEAFERVAALGGPYAAAAKEELSLLQWSRPQ